VIPHSTSVGGARARASEPARSATVSDPTISQVAGCRSRGSSPSYSTFPLNRWRSILAGQWFGDGGVLGRSGQIMLPKRTPMVVKLETLVKRLVLCVAVSCVCGCGGDGDTTGADAGLRDLAAGADLTAATDAAIANHTRNIRGVFHQTGGTDPKRNCTSCHGLDLRGGDGTKLLRLSQCRRPSNSAWRQAASVRAID
jgi:hypothetical protein